MNRFRQVGPELMRRLHLKYGLHVCCGIYEIDDLTLPVGEICDRAQIAQETISGRSDQCVALYDEELRRSLRWEQEISSQMYEALEQGQFQVYLQPIFSLSSNAPVSAEALVRWIHPERGLIPPNQFIPVLERNGFITRLDQYVWETVFQYLAEFKAAGYPALTISANMYLGEVSDPQTKRDLAVIIEETLNQRYQGVKNEAGVWITPAFPKLIYVLEEDNVRPGTPYYYLTELAAKCTAKRMVPDYISEKIMGPKSAFITTSPTIITMVSSA